MNLSKYNILAFKVFVLILILVGFMLVRENLPQQLINFPLKLGIEVVCVLYNDAFTCQDCIALVTYIYMNIEQ